MNKSQFTDFMKSPAVLPPESIVLLGKVLKEFPYCQTAQLLYAKSLHLQNSVHYNNQLKIAAAYATDRSLLYSLIHPPSPLRVVSRNDEQIVAELKTPLPLPVEEPAAVETATRTPSPIEVLEARLRELEDLRKKTENEPPSETSAPEIEKGILPEEIKSKTLNHQGPQIRKASAVPEPENLTEPINTDDTRRTAEDLETLKGTYIFTAIDASIQIEIETATPLPLDELKTEEEETASGELSFSDWIKKSGKHGISPADPVSDKQNEEKKQKETELIEKFIKEEPRISKPKKEFFSPVNAARQSVVEDLDFVTETLAGIYAKQGNTSKAIRAYQTLSLRYPEKKLYFASLIEKLESGA